MFDNLTYIKKTSSLFLHSVIDECYKLKVRGQQAGRISTQSGAPIPSSPTLDPKSDAFAKIKERVLLMEVSQLQFFLKKKLRETNVENAASSCFLTGYL